MHQSTLPTSYQAKTGPPKILLTVLMSSVLPTSGEKPNFNKFPNTGRKPTCILAASPESRAQRAPVLFSGRSYHPISCNQRIVSFAKTTFRNLGEPAFTDEQPLQSSAGWMINIAYNNIKWKLIQQTHDDHCYEQYLVKVMDSTNSFYLFLS